MWTQRFRIGQGSAIETSLPDFSGRRPDLLLVFGETDALRDHPALTRLATLYPRALHVGCSTGTVIEGPLLHDRGLVVLAVGFDRAGLRMETEPLSSADRSEAVGESLADRLMAPERSGTADSPGPLRAVLVFSPGQTINGSALVRGFRSRIGPDVVISGGLAGDGARFAETLVAINGIARPGQVAALGLYGDSLRLATGVAGGWQEFGPTRLVTRAEGPTLYELDGGPALDLYEKYLGEEARDLPAAGLIYPLRIWDPAAPEDVLVRTLLSVDRASRSITLAGDIPTGWQARLMRGTFEDLIEGASEAAEQGLAGMAAQAATASLCLMVSCVGRRLLLGQRSEDEVEAVQQALGPAVPLAGYYSYGEIAPHPATGHAHLHNQTVALTLIGEVS